MHEFRTLTPSLSVRWHAGIDPTFFRRAVELATEGFGQPAFYGDPAAMAAMTNAGVDTVDAFDVVPGGCVELGVQGLCHPWVGNFFNLPKCLELALFNGVDPRTGQQLGPQTGSPADLTSLERLFTAYEQQLGYFLELMAHSDSTADALAGRNSQHPFLSAIVDDCIEDGRDISQGGARYNFTEVQGVGIANVVDSLLNLKRLVYDTSSCTLEDILAALRANFEDAEPLLQRLRSMRPAYGTGSPETAAMAREVVHAFYDRCELRTNPRGGPFRPGLLVWTLFTNWAATVGALPDGRRAGEPLVSSIGPRIDVPVESPTDVLADVTAFDHGRCTGGLTLNLRFDHTCARTEEGLQAIIVLMETYFRRNGLQLQINVVDGAVLRDAQRHPEKHAGLLVRVSGFCARFNDLSPETQDELIARAQMRPGR
jgi:formate C-acetyltransferase